MCARQKVLGLNMKRVVIFLLIAGGVAYLIGQNMRQVKSPEPVQQAQAEVKPAPKPKKEHTQERKPENAKQEYVSATIDRVNSYNEAIGR